MKHILSLNTYDLNGLAGSEMICFDLAGYDYRFLYTVADPTHDSPLLSRKPSQPATPSSHGTRRDTLNASL